MKSSVPEHLIVPNQFGVSENGTRFGSTCLTRTPLWVSARTESAQYGAGIEISWLSESGQRSVVLAAALLHASNHTFIRVMQRLGIAVESRPLKLRQYLALSSVSVPSKGAPHAIQFIPHGRVWRVHYASGI
jgi:hypothetical protein